MISIAEGLHSIDQFLSENREQFIETLNRLIDIPSVRGESLPGKPYGQNCYLVLKEAEKLAGEMGFVWKNFDNYCLEINLPGEKGAGMKDIALFGHLDVVSPGEGWNHPPFCATRQGEYIIGRGTVDDKGPVVALLFALKYLGEQDLLKDSRVKIVLGCDEESGMEDMDYYLSRAEVPDISLVADDDFPVCHGEKGILRLDLTFPLKSDNILFFEGGTAPSSVAEFARMELVPSATADLMHQETGSTECSVRSGENGLILETTGRGAHASSPHAGLNALKPLISFLKDRNLIPVEDRDVFKVLGILLSDDYGRGACISLESEISGPLTCCATMLRKKENHLILSLDIRYPVRDNSERIVKSMGELIEPAGGDLQVIYDSAPSLVDADSPLVRKLSDLYNNLTGSHKKPYVMAGGTYARKIPGAIGFGPGSPDEQKPFGGDLGSAHGPDEAVSLETLEQAVRIYVEAAVMLDKTSSPM
ncbi:MULTISPECIES: Sapep family Mn(2+)-dependent dipeptidase [unclassified Oceanispirochaeta]|uniref:Sapep family Mn(2+)-dependent dipeptidase n=1 Tax=unclassified Oceanispirochaeta TaxID=2635722 RepID=UPI000E095C93|nr:MULTISPECIES: Sapep family Mn(2+)-dependent dipeptidase [unclassified Oceanispirochaeta]MBF9013998.1 Sapep family Mn(2+)-dependent dipeptidase [Oceanispirochaeta sp. M2]NPD70489.1 Sapep family Mn(2+)-dependent dipeptidase [Oceanispirochaeta sp. M1]RDG34258.1 M20/M25/M40 family metallo-hydrolase [Oceanispirochaeta sp. M1]